MVSPRPSTRELFELATALPEAERKAFLQDACHGDLTRLERLTRLLNADRRSERFLLDESETPHRREHSLAGVHLGDFRLERLIGAGGMGSVYEALHEPTQRLVALKLLHPALLRPESIGRFRREAKLLGHLEHPDIARLYETGELEVGGAQVPYIALELVSEGCPITRWAGEAEQPLEDRLRLFVRACRAVHFGHERGIVHRDLKPENMLVTADGELRIIDFGIARALDSNAGLGAMMTATGNLIGTPLYMSPEQLRGDGHALDPRSDVYSLGLVLYELVTNQPLLPSSDQPSPTLAEMIACDPHRRTVQISRNVRGDLAIILGNALEPELGRRYASALQLGREVERYLAGEPLEARRDQALYLLRKRLVRHRQLIAAIVTAFIASVVFSLILLSALDEAREARFESERRLYDSQIAAARNALESRNVAELKRTLAACDPRFRSWEWGHLLARSDDSIRTLHHGDSYVRDVAFSPAGHLLASCADLPERSTLRVWDLASGALRREIMVSDQHVDQVAFCHEGQQLVCCSRDGTIRFYDLATGDELRRFTQPSEARSLLLASDDDTLIAGGYDGLVRVWSLESGELRQTLAGHRGFVQRLAYSAARGWLATAGQDRTIRLWNLADGSLVRTITRSVDPSRPDQPAPPAHDGIVTGLVFSPDGSFLYSCSEDGASKLWDTQSGGLVHSENHLRPVYRLALSPDGQHLATACSDSIALRRLHEARPDAPYLGHDSPLRTVRFSPDGRYLASSDDTGEIKVFQADRRGGAFRFGGRVGVRIDAIAVSRAGTLIASGDSEGFVQIHDYPSLTRRSEFRAHESRIRSIALDPGGSRLATIAEDQRLRVWDSGSTSLIFDCATPKLARLTWARARLVSAGADGQVVIRDGTSFVQIEDRALEPDAYIAVDAAEESGLMATLSSNGELQLWSLDPLRLSSKWKGHERGVNVTLDGPFLISSGSDRVTRFWSVPDGSLHHELTVAQYPVIQARLLSADRAATVSMRGAGPTIWDLRSERVLLELTGHDRHRILTSLDRLPDGSLVTSDDGGNLWIWRSTTSR